MTAFVEPRSPLSREVALARDVVRMIAEAGIDDSDPDFAQLVESECDLNERLRRMLRAARFVEAQGEALKTMIHDMQERKKRLERKAESLRRAVSWAMQESGQKRLEAPDFTAVLGRGQPKLVGLEAIDPADLPDCLVRIKREVDRTAVRRALERGEEIDGLCLGNPQPSLIVKTA